MVAETMNNYLMCDRLLKGKLCRLSITCTYSITDMDSERHFRNHVKLQIYHCVKLLGLVRSLTLSFSYFECTMYMPYFTLYISLNTPLLFRIPLCLLMPINWNTYSRSLYLSVLIVSLPMSITVVLTL